MAGDVRTFKLELDLSLYFAPPMDEHGSGIVVTRGIELPFVPSPGLMVWSKSMDDCPEPAGFKLEDLTWDIDRQVFLAKTTLIHQDLPMVLIPEVLRSFIDRGWRLGSYLEKYEGEDELTTEDEADPCKSEETDGEDEWEAMEQWPGMRPQARPPEYNKIFRAMIRTMVELYNNLPTAYAMDKTKRFFSEAEIKDSDLPIVQKWRDAQYEFKCMTWEKKRDWLERVVKKHPDLEKIVDGL